MSIEKRRFEATKRHLGSGTPGTEAYALGAAKALSQFATQNPMREDTRDKLRDLTLNADPKTRDIAIQALQGRAYVDEDEELDIDTETDTDSDRDD